MGTADVTDRARRTDGAQRRLRGDGTAGRPVARWWEGALAGLLAAGVALAVAQIVSAFIARTNSPVVSVGEWVIDHVPPGVKEFAISTFGTNDKVALIAGTLVFLLIFAAVIGILARRRLWIGIVGIALFGVVGAAAALTRPAATTVAMVPSLVGATAAIAAIIWLLRPASTAWSATKTDDLVRDDVTLAGEEANTDDADGPEADVETRVMTIDAEERPATMIATSAPSAVGTTSTSTTTTTTTDAPAGSSVTVRPDRSGAPAGFDRRAFLTRAAVIGAGAIVVGGIGRSQQGRFDVNVARQGLTLPPPASPASAVPAGVDLGVPGIAPFMTANGDFYRVDTALVAPQVAPGDWSLTLRGMVDRELTFTYEDLLNRSLVERDLTLVCVSNEVGGTYAGTARWLGVPLSELLDEAGVQDGSDQLVSRSVDGWTAGTPMSALRDGRDAIVAIGMNGEPLPVEHGFPARLVVPGLYGYTSATKWVTELEATTFDAYDAYWVERSWAQRAPIKTLTRIDTPRGLANISPGRTAIGGVAWAIHRGIRQVEVKIDDGPWQVARLGEVPNADTWRQWTLDWDATPGTHNVTARATDETGTLQTMDRAAPIPDGASGWHSIVVLVN